MMKHRNLFLLVCLLVSIWSFSVYGQAPQTLPVKDFSWSLKNVPPEKIGGVSFCVNITDSTLAADGKTIPCRKITMKYSKGNTLTLTLKLNTPVDLWNSYHELSSYFQCTDGIALGKVMSLEVGNSQGKKTPGEIGILDKSDNVYRMKWDAMHEPSWNRIIDLSTFNSITITLKMDAWEDMEKTVTVCIGDFVLTKNNHWAESYPERERSWLAWLDWLSKFKPDYSDSSKSLLPPENGRIKTPLQLTIGGKPNAEIVIAKDEYGVIENIAKDFQKQVMNITGAELPIVEQPGGMPVKLFLNSPDAVRKYGKDMEYLKDLKPHFGEDGYFIRTEGNNIYIGGVVPTGIKNGLYRFLENNTTIIWARGDETFGTVYDKTPDLSIVWADALVKPLTPYRGWRGAPPEWSARNGANDSIPVQWGGRGNLLGNFSDYLPNRPPYQCYVDGAYLPFGYYSSQVCISQKDSYDLILQKMIRNIREKREKGERVTSINWVTEDNWYVCTCYECTKPITLPDGTVLTSNGKSLKNTMEKQEQIFRSNQFYLFANRLARGLREAYPDVRLQVLAYFFMEPAPAFKREDNMNIVFAPLYTRADFRNPIFAPTNSGVWNIRQGQLNAGGTMELYEYYFQHPFAEMLKFDVEDYMKSGFRDFGSELPGECGSLEAWYGWDFAMVDYWCFNRIAFDYTEDVEQLRKYFLRRVYREGAPVLEKFYGMIREKYYAGIRGQHESKYPGLLQPYIFEAGQGEALLNELKAALPKIKNPAARINFGRFLRQYESIYDSWLVKTKKKAAPPVPDSKLPREVVDLFRNQIMFNWRDDSEVSNVLTTAEYKGKFIDAVRFRFTPKPGNGKNKNLRKIGIFRSKWMGDKTPIPFPGRIVMKVRAVTPGIAPDKLPSFGVWGKGEEQSKPSDYIELQGGVFELTYSPLGAGVNLDDITGLAVMYPRDQINPEKGYAEFDFFDIRVEKITTSKEPDEKTFSEILDKE